MSELTRLAKHVYLLTQDEVWRGGKGGTLPHRLQEPKEFHNRRSYWTVSPEVELGDHKVRVLVHHREPDYDQIYGGGWHEVYVYVDGRLIYPGGQYRVSWIFSPLRYFSWSTRVIKQEIWEGGRDSKVPGVGRKKMLQDAKLQVKGVPHLLQAPSDEDLRKAQEEVERHVRRVKS